MKSSLPRCLLLGVFTVLGIASVSHGEITIVQRQSVGGFDVLAAVGPVVDRERIAPPIFAEPTGSFSLINSYDAFAIFDNGSIAGSASAFGSLFHVDTVSLAPDRLALQYLNTANGIIDAEGAGGAASSGIANMFLVFSVTEETSFTYDLNIGPIIGNSLCSVVFRNTINTLTIINTDETGHLVGSGTLPPDNYQVYIISHGGATSANGEPDVDPPYFNSLNFSLRVGGFLPGDVNLDGVVNLLDVDNFIDAVASGNFQFEADINGDGVVNLLDINGFIAILGGN